MTLSYDTLGLLRGIDAYLNCVPGRSMLAMRNGLRSVGARLGRDRAATDPRSTSAPVVLTPANTETTYGTTFLDLKAGAPRWWRSRRTRLSFVDDLWHRLCGRHGQRRTRTGVRAAATCSFRPATTARSPMAAWRGPLGHPLELDHVPRPGRDRLPAHHPHLTPSQGQKLTRPKRGSSTWPSHRSTASTPTTSVSSRRSTPSSRRTGRALDPERAGQLAAIGIVHGQAFAPDAHRRAILDQAAKIAAGFVRTLLYKPRDRRAYFYEGSSWKTAFVGGSHEFLADGARLLDFRAMMHYVGTGITPAMTHASVGVGSQYAYTAEDATRRLVGRRQELRPHPARPHPGQDVLGHRHLRHPDPVPAPDRQPLPEHPQPRRRSPAEDNGDTIIHFGPPHRPTPTSTGCGPSPAKAGFPILRLYGPFNPGSTKTWRPGEIQPA